jgi:hypothetical protein
MEQSMLEQNLEEHGPLVMQEVPPVPRLPSYHPTAWAFVNRVLDIVDTKTGGRAAWCQRFFMFAFIGGFAALVNMTVFYLVFYVIALPVNETMHNVIAAVLAAEFSIIVGCALYAFPYYLCWWQRPYICDPVYYQPFIAYAAYYRAGDSPDSRAVL